VHGKRKNGVGGVGGWLEIGGKRESPDSEKRVDSPSLLGEEP